MPNQRLEQKTFEREDFTERRPFHGELIQCTFDGCDFTGADLSSVAFIDCTFNTCNFSLANLKNTRLQHVQFNHCKLMGVDFSQCSNFSFAPNFLGCNLNFASFLRKKMPGTTFSDCAIHEANFTEADLANATFDECDLSNTVFYRTNLRSADFRTTLRFSIDPAQNTVQRAKFSRAALGGLLEKFNLDID